MKTVSIEVAPGFFSQFGNAIVGTATDANGNTSEFSPAFLPPVEVPPSPLLIETPLFPMIDDGIAVVGIALLEIPDPEFEDLPSSTSTGIQSFDAVLQYDSSGMEILDIRFGETFGENTEYIDNGSTLTINGTWDEAEGVITELPAVLASVVLRLTGSATEVSGLTLETLDVTEADNPETISLEQSFSLEFQRGDAHANGIVDIFDALFIAQCLVEQRDYGLAESDCNPVNAASVDQDDEGGDQVTIFDAMFIGQYLVESRNEFFE